MEKELRSDVFNMDCVEYMKTLPDDYFDLAVADPPYGHGGSEAFIKGGRFHKGRFNRYRQVDGNPIDIDEWDKAPDDDFFEELFRVSKNQIIWGANYFDGMPATRCFLIWKKQIPENFSMAMCEYAWIFKNYAKAGDLVFDPTFGSGSSRIAAYKLGLHYVGCEISPLYFNKGVERFDRICKGEIRQANGQTVVQTSLFD